MAAVQKKFNKLDVINIMTIAMFIVFHLILLTVLDFQVISEKTRIDYRDNIFYDISCYGIAYSLIGIFVIGMIKSIWRCHSISYVKNMLLSFVCSLIASSLYYETNLYLQKDIIDYVSLICCTVSFTLILLFIIVGLMNYRMEKDRRIGRRIYRDFIIIDIIMLVIVLLGGFIALNYVRGEAELIIILIMVHMSPALVVLEVWGAVMYIIYRIKK